LKILSSAFYIIDHIHSPKTLKAALICDGLVCPAEEEEICHPWATVISAFLLKDIKITPNKTAQITTQRKEKYSNSMQAKWFLR
jgi:hypothetical protein